MLRFGPLFPSPAFHALSFRLSTEAVSAAMSERQWHPNFIFENSNRVLPLGLELSLNALQALRRLRLLVVSLFARSNFLSLGVSPQTSRPIPGYVPGNMLPTFLSTELSSRYSLVATFLRNAVGQCCHHCVTAGVKPIRFSSAWSSMIFWSVCVITVSCHKACCCHKFHVNLSTTFRQPYS